MKPAQGGSTQLAPVAAAQPGGVSEQWFREELRKYQKVRDETWQAWNATPFFALAVAILKPSQSNGSSSKTASTTIPRAQAREGDFWALLRQRLVAAIGDVAADRILSDFRPRHTKFIASMSYDDLERLAVALQPDS